MRLATYFSCKFFIALFSILRYALIIIILIKEFYHTNEKHYHLQPNKGFDSDFHYQGGAMKWILIENHCH